MPKTLSPALILALLLLTSCAHFEKAKPMTAGFHPASFSRTITKKVGGQFLLYLPDGYAEDPGQCWPLILFLHGIGERGRDLDKLKVTGLPQKLAAGVPLPFIIVCPQCPNDESWSPDTLNALLDEVIGQCRVDEDRVYLTGLSMGGSGTWALAGEHPERFAAIAPICGRGNIARARRFKHLPTWAFHGARDEVVPIRESEIMVKAIQKIGGEVKFTVYPEAGHDSWTETYDNPELYQWLLAYRRPKAK